MLSYTLLNNTVRQRAAQKAQALRYRFTPGAVPALRALGSGCTSEEQQTNEWARTADSWEGPVPKSQVFMHWHGQRARLSA